MHVASLVVSIKITIHFFWMAQIALLIADKTFVTIPTEYSNFATIFLSESTAELSKYTRINNHPIKLINN